MPCKTRNPDRSFSNLSSFFFSQPQGQQVEMVVYPDEAVPLLEAEEGIQNALQNP